MASEMQGIPPEPSLTVVFCNKPVKVQMKKKKPNPLKSTNLQFFGHCLEDLLHWNSVI